MRDEEMVSASELGEYVYCRRAWWLRRIIGVAPDVTARSAMDAGSLWHEEQWIDLKQQRRESPIRLWTGWIALALAAGLLMLWWWRR